MTALKSLSKFPKGSRKAAVVFNPKSYGIDVRTQVAAPSDFTGEFSVEIEVEGRGLPANYGGPTVDGVTWVTHNEGSLRNGGREYVLSAPTSIDNIRVLVDNLFAYIREVGGRVENSTRCSTHVHVNARGMKLNQLASFVVLYGTFETVLTNWCEPSRHGNLFALRLCDSHYAVDGWRKAFKNGDFNWPHELRYLALNPAALMRFGSLEIRTLQGIDRVEPLILWLRAIERLRDVALTFTNPSDIAIRLSGQGGRGFFDEVFDGLEIKQAVEMANDNIEMDVRDGFRLVQPIAYDLPWEVVADECAKVFIPDPFGGAIKRAKPARRGDGPVALTLDMAFQRNEGPEIDEDD